MANPNPSPETRFKPGETLNPLGKTSEQRKAEVKASEIAANLRLAILSRMQERVEAGEDVADLLTSDALRLFKDSEDRAHGTPKQTLHGAGDEGEHLIKATADEAFARIASRLAGVAPGTAGSPDSEE